MVMSGLFSSNNKTKEERLLHNNWNLCVDRTVYYNIQETLENIL